MVEILNNFKDCELISKGGQKNVYKCMHPDYGDIILKVGNFTSLSTLERIRREVELLRNLDSDYFPKNYDFIVDLKKKEFFIVEELIHGEELKNVKNLFKEERDIIRLLVELIRGLGLIWLKNIVHRDLKPGNILIGENKEPVIIDLGIARFIDYEDLTKTLALRGPCTPFYAAPEQIHNRKDIIDIRTDFFLLGIIILELHLGFHPFSPERVGKGNSIPYNICKGSYIAPNSKDYTSDEFCYLVNKLLEIEPYRRFRDRELLEEYINEHWGDL